jgi:ribose transport system ATP-binding protein
MLSEDRKGEGLALPMTVADNLTLSSLPVVVRAAWQRAVSADWIKTLGVRGGAADDRVEKLSGGNQQKVALGRLLQQNAEILLLDQPGRGIDVGAKSEICALIDRLAASGKAILMVSDDLGELLGTCDRIAVMHRGVLGEAMYTCDWTPETLLAAALGTDGGAPS